MRVLIATDGSEYSYEAARDFINLSHTPRHEITILYVLPLLMVGRDPSYTELELQREGYQALNTMKSIFDETAIPVETELRQGIPANTILEVARDGEFDLIVIGRRGRGGFREYLLGSVSKTVIQNAPCSVLIGK